MLKILLVDDHAVVRDGLAAILSTEPSFEVVAAVASIDQALQRLRGQAIDVVLLDLLLGEDNAVDRLDSIRQIAPDTVVLMLSSVQDERQARQAIRQGAAGFLTKDMDADALILAIKAATRGEMQLSSKLDPRLVRGAGAIDS
ncbi:MAG: response regulator transcription factor, partial [Xanthomonadales bacterium]|nr:response regulator transcription factor [Xanthomonadales bacterium]